MLALAPVLLFADLRLFAARIGGLLLWALSKMRNPGRLAIASRAADTSQWSCFQGCCVMSECSRARSRPSPRSQPEAMAAATKGAQLRILNGSGRMAPVEDPEGFNKILREWLA